MRITSKGRLSGGIALALAAAALTAAPAYAQDFAWNGRIAPGQTVEIKGVNGSIRAVRADGDAVMVDAVKRARRSNPDEVEIVVVEHAGGVTICAVYPTPAGARPNECAPGDGGRLSSRDNDVRVEFTVRVPDDIHLVARTVNGEVDARGLGGDVVARTVNGDVTIETAGTAEAQTVNGSIEAALGRADWSGRIDFKTVNGSITLELPVDLHTDLRAQTVNGGIETDFPLQIQGRLIRTRVNGRIGNGGRELSLETVNGSIRLRKAAAT